MAALTQKEKAEAFDKLIEKSKEHTKISHACSELIGYYTAQSSFELVEIFTELRSKARSW